MDTSASQDLLEDALEQVAKADSERTLDEVRVRFLGKKGALTAQLKALGQLPPEQRREAGQQINRAKQTLEQAIAQRAERLARERLDARLAEEQIDVTLPGRTTSAGGVHPVNRAMHRLLDIFQRLGFEVATGPEVEDDYYNFEALNFPPHHPARAMHDTFYLPDGRLLRTHTSPVQIRVMKERGAPVRIVAPGRVYRSDSDQTHTPQFHQIEGLLVDRDVTFADLKGMLSDFVNAFFEDDLEMRLRPSYFPFTEPSAEVDVRWRHPDGSAGDWLEVLGCGMVHPNVLENCGVDPEVYTGYAWGLGVERFAMLRYRVDDLRLFFDNELRFLRQFR
ncbi:phenylalanine--tRNA ligase subunit alpha [Wenzhouxiangella sp. XN201]|uniref:phenylalanine--tRNA ligase subunit alpha n=1 Tax=Wenzhouxiangella sp. XN201 TaxID=2710755 RepID=UPI0013C9E137|nr:phenylalanine--tRNA ligase subunit alpha [Wenzhouxiangella sp. XN201]NEZ03827.1 phenylalanine--tRNA ligase subunit alpha [Wenzhouxiangella sp. XN201]